jgi:hypothetical protein
MFLELFKLKVSFFIIPIILLFHEMEEWNIYKFHKENYSNIIHEETILSGRLWLLFLSLFGFIWTIICYFIPNLIISTILMVLLIDFTILNSIQHIGLSIKIKKYNPGLIFGGIIALIAAIFFIQNIVIEKILPIWSVILLLGIIIPFIVETIISSKKNKLPQIVIWILRFSIKLEKILSE